MTKNKETKESKKLTIYDKSNRRSATGIIIFIFLLINAATIIFSFGWALLSSLKGRLDFHSNIFGLPKKWMFSNFASAFKELYVEIPFGGSTRNVFLPEMVLNSLIVGVVPNILLILMTALCMYTLAKYKFRGRRLIHTILIFVMVMPIVGNLPAQLKFQMGLGVYDSIPWLYVTSFTIWTGPWLILYATFKSLSWDFAEAAFIDGAGHFRVFWTIMLPMIKTVIFILFLLAFIASWNDYYLALVYLPSTPTLALGLFKFQFSKAQIASSVTVQLAAAIMSAVPTIILFFIFKDKMMGSLTSGGLKG